jgi:two-component system CheB/CheR fusion protein
MLGRLLANEGHSILLAEDSKQARMLALGAVQPDLVVAGFQFPKGMNGLEVILDVRELLGRRIPAVVLTGYISTDVIREISRQGCVQRTKPIKADDLLVLMQSLLVASDTRTNRTASSSLRESGSAGQLPTISVVDDDSSIREAMREMFQDEEGWSIETYSSAEAYLEAFHPKPGSILLVDAQMPGMDGVDLLEQLRADGHRPSAIMISGHADIRLAVRAMRAGAVAFLEKPVQYDELAGYIEQALELSRSSAARSSWHETAAKRIATLTLREHQVMELVLEGKANKIIAHALGISQRTVETHRATVMKKTNSRSLSELIHVAIAGAAQP